jgi:predicted DNA-binding WGR domain protein
MKDNQIYFYNTTVDEALEMLEMESRRDNAMINLEDFEVKLNKKGDHVMVTLLRGLGDMDIDEGIIQIKIDFPGKYRDMESIDRVRAVLALNPNSDWWKGIVEELEEGYPLSWRVEEILIETEERIENPDEDVLAKLDQAIASNPRFRLLQSFKQQVLSGRELSERQMEILEENLGSSAPSNTNQIARINEALALDPRNRFVNQLKQKAEQGITLSERQMNVVEEIIGSNSSPAAKMLADLKANAYLEREDFMLINKGQRRGIDSLNDEERKRLRHLIYRNERKLDNTYSKDEVRRLLKKGTAMRRSASEIIRDLEMRIARLEANLNNREASMTREAAGDPQLAGVRSSTAYHEGRSMAEATSCMLYLIGESENKSKFYEMVVNGSTVEILYGRLGSTGRRADKSFMDSYDAQAFFVKQLKSKLKKGYVSAFAQRGEHRKSGPLYGTYPIGLTSNPGMWQNQDIAYDTSMISSTISAVREAIASFQMDGIVDERAVSMLVSAQRSLRLNRDQLSEEASEGIRLALDRIQGTGRAGRQPVEVRTRTAIKGLQKLMRKLEGAMSGGRRRASYQKKSW